MIRIVVGGHSTSRRSASLPEFRGRPATVEVKSDLDAVMANAGGTE